MEQICACLFPLASFHVTFCTPLSAALKFHYAKYVQTSHEDERAKAGSHYKDKMSLDLDWFLPYSNPVVVITKTETRWTVWER